jgi:hypothetical protein
MITLAMVAMVLKFVIYSVQSLLFRTNVECGKQNKEYDKSLFELDHERENH